MKTSIIEQRDIRNRTRTKKGVTVLLLLGVTMLFQFAGCVHSQLDSFEPRRRPVLERLRLKKAQASEEAVQAQTELVLKVNGRIESLRLAFNDRRILLERRLGFDETEFDHPETSLIENFLVEEDRGKFGAELWNIEFSDARQENFSRDYVTLLEPDLSCAALDEEGKRLFWINRGEQTTHPAQGNESPFACLEEESADLEFVEFGSFENDFSRQNDAENFVHNAVLTRLLESRLYMQDGDLVSLSAEEDVKHMKIADETKSADSVWISPNARWLICRTANQTNLANNPSESDDLTDPNWTLALLRDRKRVVKFPSSVKMTFDNSRSDDAIEGRIVDVLDVSDEGDLVATLVEEQFPVIESEPSLVFTTQDFKLASDDAQSIITNTPRYKIVIWDLNVARTVDLEKAKRPLMALEVSQIPIPAPIPRKFCKFSPTGERFAARVEARYVTIWQSASGRLSIELGEHNDVIQDFAFAPNSAKMVIGVGGNKPQIALWEIRKGVVHRTLDDTINSATSIDAVAFSSDERYVYFPNNFGEVKRWNIHAR